MANKTVHLVAYVGMTHTKAIFYASCSVSVIIVSSLVTATLMYPVLKKNVSHLVINFLMALGVGCLAGDALFHLIPHAINPRVAVRYLDIDVDPHADSIVLWRSFVIVLSIYVFYLLHVVTHSMVGGHSHSHHEQQAHTPVKFFSSGNTLVVMIIVGDFIHSINDGMAIGGAFSKSASDGLSTSLAVLFHEVPHVVADFAVLIASGLTIKISLFLQAFALAPMYAGLVVGVLLGTALNLTDWIFAVTGGMFLFVSLTEMVPELLDDASESKDSQCNLLAVQNVGMIAGFGIMALLAAFEQKIKRALS